MDQVEAGGGSALARRPHPRGFAKERKPALTPRIMVRGDRGPPPDIPWRLCPQPPRPRGASQGFDEPQRGAQADWPAPHYTCTHPMRCARVSVAPVAARPQSYHGRLVTPMKGPLGRPSLGPVQGNGPAWRRGAGMRLQQRLRWFLSHASMADDSLALATAIVDPLLSRESAKSRHCPQTSGPTKAQRPRTNPRLECFLPAAP